MQQEKFSSIIAELAAASPEGLDGRIEVSHLDKVINYGTFQTWISDFATADTARRDWIISFLRGVAELNRDPFGLNDFELVRSILQNPSQHSDDEAAAANMLVSQLEALRDGALKDGKETIESRVVSSGIERLLGRK